MKITALGGAPPPGVTTLEVPRDSLGFIFTHGEEKVCVQFVDAAMGGGAMPRMMLPEMSLTELTSLMTPSTALASFGIPPSLPVPPDERDLPLAPGSDPPLEALMGLCLEIKEQPYDKTVMYTRKLLKDLRKKKGMNQGEWGKKLGIHQTHVGQIESGTRIRYSTFRQIEEQLDIILDPDLLSKCPRGAGLQGVPHPRETLAARLAAARGKISQEEMTHVDLPPPFPQRPNSKKRQVVMKALQNPTMVAWSDKRIAIRYGTSDRFVGMVRKALGVRSSNPRLAKRKNGTEYPMRMTKLACAKG